MKFRAMCRLAGERVAVAKCVEAATADDVGDAARRAIPDCVAVVGIEPWPEGEIEPLPETMAERPTAALEGDAGDDPGGAVAEDEALRIAHQSPEDDLPPPPEPEPAPVERAARPMRALGGRAAIEPAPRIQENPRLADRTLQDAIDEATGRKPRARTR